MRRSKTLEQQAKFYEVDDFCEYLTEVFVNGNFSSFEQLYKELTKKDRAAYVAAVKSAWPQYFDDMCRLYGVMLGAK